MVSYTVSGCASVAYQIVSVWYLLQKLPYRKETVSVDVVNKGVGIDESAENISKILNKMCLKSEVVQEGKAVEIEIPPTRAGQLPWQCYSYT